MPDWTVVREWLATLAPYIAIAVSLWLGSRIQVVHRLVNSEMASFRKSLQELAAANEASVFRDGQQQVRDTTKGIVQAAALATEAAAQATVAAASVLEKIQPRP